MNRANGVVARPPGQGQSKAARRRRRERQAAAPARAGARKNTGSLNVVQASVPIAKPARVQFQAPRITQSNGTTVICGQDLVVDPLSGSTSFSASKLQINPGLSSVFAWLADRANGYEKYRFRKLEFVYVPSNANTSTAGAVYLAMDYDPDDSAPGTLANMATYETQNQGKVYEVVRLHVDTRRVQAAKLKVRCGPKAGSRLLYDPCSLIYATDDCADTSDLGKVWAYYEIELYSPQVEPSTPLPVALSCWNLASNQTFTTTTAATLQTAEEIANGLGLTNSSGSVTLPCGLYRIYGDLCFQDSSAETLSVVAKCFLDGADAVTAVPQIALYNNAMVAGGQDNLSFHFYALVGSAGAALTINVTMTGAAGTLVAVSDRTRLFVEAVG